ncbi:MAG: hypothetical protein BRC31_07035 [Actinobacteria bacterium QS_5_72_10]|nr:MAG: hypothetical protein BRC31_07035 [Actinobacteria bacterium QS_5_72_10]
MLRRLDTREAPTLEHPEDIMHACRPLAVLVAVAVLLLGAVPVAAQEAGEEQPNVTGAVQVTDNPHPARAHSSPQMAVNPQTGELAIVETEVRSDYSCRVHVSSDGGRTWRDGGALHEQPHTDCSRDPLNGPYATVAFANDGVLYVAYMASDPEQAGTDTLPVGIFLARSEDGGETFETHAVSAPDEEAPDKARPMLAVDPNDADTVHVSWMAQPGEGKSLAQVATTTNGGETFSEPTDLSLDKGGYQPRLAVSPDSTVHAVFPASSFHEEKSFDEVVRPLMYARSTDAGQSWSEATAIDPGNTGFYAMRKAVIAADSNDGTVYTVWYGNEKTTIDPKEEDVDIFMRRSTDGGDTWSDRVTINDDADEGYTNHYDPGIAIAPNGRVDVAWYDFRNSPYTERFPDGFEPPFNHDGFQDVYYSYSTDNGQTWSRDVRITDRIINREIGVWSNNIHSHMSVGIAATNAAASFAWQDTRNGNYRNEAEDVYAASAIHDPGARRAAAAEGSTSTLLWVLLGAAGGLGLAGVVLLVGMRVASRDPAPAGAPAPARGG